MRVLYFLDTINRGGAETQAIDVCRNARRFGIDVTVAAGPGDLWEDLRQTGVDVISIRRRFPVDPPVISKLRAEIVKRDVKVVHGYQAVESIHLYMAARNLPAVRQVMSFQGFIPDAKNRSALRFLIPRTDANLYVSEGLRAWISRVDRLDTNTSARVLYNGADPARLRPTGNSIRAELGIGKDTILFGMIANFYRDPRKDQLTLARSLSAVFKDAPDAVCLFVGKTEPGADQKLEECRRICSEAGIANRVYFLGGRNDVPDILAGLDVFVLSSLQEGLPVALTEAMLAGVPAVVSDIAPHLEATDGGKAAAVFCTGDAEDLARKLTAVCSSPEFRRELGAKGKAHAEENFSIDAHMRGLSEIYSELLDRPARMTERASRAKSALRERGR